MGQVLHALLCLVQPSQAHPAQSRHAAVTHLDDHLVQLLLMALHLAILLDLQHGGVLLVPQADDLVKGEDEVEGAQAHGFLFQQALTELRH